jgi:Fe(3+) dicitrate transport protein
MNINKKSNSNLKVNSRKSLLALAIISSTFVGTVNTVFAAESIATESALKKQVASAASELTERLQIIGHSDKLRKEAGSATLIGEVELEKFKFDDINRILYNVPGVNIREEDGYGLRPNIGFRGATPERSKKITIMEDGVLIGPAPYSAPAAYYFPMMSKMTSLEIFKGPAAIKYGPNTVAGALNMTTRAVPDGSEGLVDVAVGSDGFIKTKGYYGNTNGNFGYLIEGVHLEADGFKALDNSAVNGGKTGFTKNDIMVKLQYDLSSNDTKQLIELKYSNAVEESNETYLGLSDADFYQNPNRRYVASEKDFMDWDHQQLQLTHFISQDNFDITTRVYRNDFSRSWNKINGFKGGLVTRDLQEILNTPTDEVNALFYQVLTGQRDSQREYEKIVLGDNFREYYSQGIQSELQTSLSLFNFEHKIEAGIRIHQDQIKRRHTEENYLMQDAQLVTDGSETIATTTNLEETDAVSIFMQDTINLDALALTFGIRGEFFDSYYQNQAPNKQDDWLKKDNSIWLPSVSAFYTLSENTGLLFGIHEGFVPTSPQESPEIDIENSVNFEIGARYNKANSKAEVVVFFNDISNLKEGCSFSAAASCGDSLDAEFNGGEVDVLGLELSASTSVTLDNGYEIPLSLVYTHTSSEFKTSFASDFPMWGEITSGDKLPYLPENQVSLGLGLIANLWELNFSARYIGEMQEASGANVLLSGVTTAAYIVVDFSANYDLSKYGQLYFKADNIFDEQEIVSRRPYGARPSKPQQFQVGYQYSF